MANMVSSVEMASWLGISSLQLRRWLRTKMRAGDLRLASHQLGLRWKFSPALAQDLADEYTSSNTMHRSHQCKQSLVQTQRPLSQSPGHRVTVDWMNETVVTLADLLRRGLHAVVVGINPAPVSVAVGHYYQGRFGQHFFKLLSRGGLLPSGEGFDDDRAFAAGVGFTDVVKRPTPNKNGVRLRELRHGRQLLEKKLIDIHVPKIIFAFKCAATPLIGHFKGYGLIQGRPLARAEVFVMPSPMERREQVERALCQLRDWWAE